ncbi:hypothetical protein FSP39_008018 [Pinctada imbricata]|uniref:Carboxylic ester hydrolase n=1 Tax=Pinctada imbricata TaxID=66713 RepID=A0AA88Y5N2_PINIB|nr:hypothetical protein FSP39_008018 [Pinctada imbricata]
MLSVILHVLCSDKLIRNTKYGRIRGFLSNGLEGQKVEQYLGIPFAAPPIVDLRFENPVPPAEWEGIRNCTVLPPACPQNPDLLYIRKHTPKFNKENEDCLYLNVYVPQDRGPSLLPVLLYIHGGSNRVGMGAMLRGDILAGYGKIVVVNFNYRLGSLGFYAVKKEGLNGNYGFLDQVMAMQWVKDNIATFGGDPERVTIAGHSAGAADAGFHILSPLSKGLFQQVMIMSGSPLAFWGIAAPDWPSGTNINDACIDLLCPNAGMRQFYPTLKEYLRGIHWREFKNKDNSPTPVRYREVLTFPVAIVDGYFVTERPEVTLKKGKFNGDNFVFSFTRDEGALDVVAVQGFFDNKPMTMDMFRQALDWYQPIYPYVPNLKELILHEYGGWEWYPDNEDHDTISQRFTRMESDVVFISPMIKMADMMSKSTENIRVFTFDHVSSATEKPNWLGVPHGEDLFYIFGIPFVGFEYPNGTVDIPYTDLDRNVSRIMMSTWSNFVKYGKLSNNAEKDGRKYNGTKRRYTKIESTKSSILISELENYQPQKMAFWNDLLPRISHNNKQRRGSPTTPGSSTYSKTTKHPMQKHRADKHRKRRKRDKEHQRTTQKHQTQMATHKPTSPRASGAD